MFLCYWINVPVPLTLSLAWYSTIRDTDLSQCSLKNGSNLQSEGRIAYFIHYLTEMINLIKPWGHISICPTQHHHQTIVEVNDVVQVPTYRLMMKHPVPLLSQRIARRWHILALPVLFGHVRQTNSYITTLTKPDWPCNEPQLSPCRRHISLCIFSGVELKLFHWECLFLVSYGNIKRKPGFFTSTESGRGITGTALQIYKLYLDSASFSCKTWSSWHILTFMRVRGQVPDSFLSWIWDFELLLSLSCACALLLTVLTDDRWLSWHTV